MQDIFISYLICINLIGFFIMGVDKQKAKKNKWRIKEFTLLTICALGGALGSLLGMNIFRHKTKHLKFKIGIPLFLLINMVLVYCIFMYI